MAKTSLNHLGTVFVARVDEVEPLVSSEGGSIAAGDAVRHPDEGPCLVLARLGDHLMVEAEAPHATWHDRAA